MRNSCSIVTTFALAMAGSPLKRLAIVALTASLVFSRNAVSQQPLADAHGTDQTLPGLIVRGVPSVAFKNQLPVVTESVTAEQMAESINVISVDDAVKYLPGLQVRKRYIGDRESPLATRTSGVGASARSLIFADGVLLSALIGNNNGIASPRWNMVSPEEIARVDVMYGPFAAAYAGNSMGAVVEMTTRMPAELEGGAKVLRAWHGFDLYGTKNTYNNEQGSFIVGNRNGDFSWWLSGSRLDASSQPETIVTTTRVSAAVAGLPVVTGGFAARTPQEADAVVLGAANLTHSVQDNARIKIAYDFSPAWRASYTLGMWTNTATTRAQSYLLDAAGNPFYNVAGDNVNIGGFRYSIPASAFSNNVRRLDQEHSMHSIVLRSDTRGIWDWEAVASLYDYGRDLTRNPTVALPAAVAGGAGRRSHLEGTGWNTLDLKGVWRSDGLNGAHQVSFGLHRDVVNLSNPTYNAVDWLAGSDGALFSDSRGKTRTDALWAQEVWRFAPDFKFTAGGRYEKWRAYDGVSASTIGAALVTVSHAQRRESHFSPKASLLWSATPQWQFTASAGQAYRFPTVGELFQTVTTGVVLSNPDPSLKPEKALSGELSAERTLFDGKFRATLFHEDASNALISQPGIAANGAATTFIQNVGLVRTSGVEVVAQKNDAFIRGLDLGGSVTYADSMIVRNDINPASVGHRQPRVPDWRATFTSTYRLGESLAATVAARYSGRQFSQMNNSDTNQQTWTGFQSFLVVDARLRYQNARRWSASLGIDNLNNYKYFLFHPFPQRTLVAELKLNY